MIERESRFNQPGRNMMPCPPFARRSFLLFEHAKGMPK
jgi:hypothetical protein